MKSKLKKLFTALLSIIMVLGMDMSSNAAINRLWVEGGQGTAEILDYHDEGKSRVYNIKATPASGYRFVEWSFPLDYFTMEDGDEYKPITTIIEDSYRSSSAYNITAHLEEIPKHNIAILVEGQGEATATPSSEAEEDSTVNLAATPASGYQFKEWRVDSGGVTLGDLSSAQTTFTMGTQDVQITAVFEELYNVSTQVEGGGTATANPALGPKDTTINLTASPDQGYQFNKWEVISGGVEILDPTSTPTSFILGTSPVEVKAFFDKLYNITTSAEGIGAAAGKDCGSASSDVSSGPQGTNVTLTATPFTGYSFKNWEVVSGGVTLADPNSATTTFALGTENVEVKALFEELHNVTISVEGQGEATATPSSDITQVTTINLEATPTSGHRFKEWRSNDVTIPNPHSANTSFEMPDKNVNITAVFEEIPKYNVTTSVEGLGTAEAEPTVDVEGTTVNLRAAPAQGYQFKNWQVISGNVTLVDPSSANTSFELGNEDVEVRAIFGQLHSVDITVEGEGTATAEPTLDLEGTTIHLTATPAQGYQFKNWEVVSGDVELVDPTSATTSFTLGASNVEIKAVFEAIYNVTTSVEGQGTATAIPTSGPNGTIVTLRAVPAENYQFKNWEVVSGGVTLENPNSSLTNFELGEENVEVKAVFEEITVTGIALNSDNAKKEYIVGDELDLNNLVLTVSKSDGTTETIAITEDMISGFDNSQTGTQTITVTYEGFSDSYEVEVKEKEKEKEEVKPTPTTPDIRENDIETQTSYETGGKTGSMETVPDTGDHSNHVIWIFMMVVSSVGLIFTSSWWQRRRFNR